MTEIRKHTLDNGQSLAFRHTPGTGPAIIFLPGYMSDMDGGKATAVFDDCAARGQECLLLDYSGCGQSDGDFADGTLTRWAQDVGTLVSAYVKSSRLVFVGSSMGGWLMLLLGMAAGKRLAGCIGIAAAPDFSDWGFDEAQKAQLQAGETIFEESDYGYDPMPTHALFWRDAEENRLLGAKIPISAPVRFLHGQEDRDVPPETSIRAAAALQSEDVQVTLVKGGDHRLSRESDIALLLSTVRTLVAQVN